MFDKMTSGGMSIRNCETIVTIHSDKNGQGEVTWKGRKEQVKTKVFRRILAIMMIVCLIFGNLTMAFAEENTATTLRLAKTEGTVAVKNRNGKEMTILDDMKLYNGYHVGTGEASYAWMNLDDRKMAKLDAVSEAEVRQRGKEFELMLDSGNLFFNVTSPLSADETLNIRTSTMVTGIRGTAGWVKVISQWQTKVYILEGTVTVSVTDPVTGQVKTATLGAGQVAECWVYDQNRAGDKCDILMGRFSETDVDGFVAAEFVSNGALKNRVAQGGSGLDAEKIANGAAAKLQSDQNQIHQLLADVDRNLQSQDNNVLIDPVFTERATTAGTSTGGSGGGGGGGGGGGSHSGGSSSGTTNGGNNSNTTTEPSETVADPTTLTMPQTAATVNEYLNDKHVSVVLQGTGNDTFSIDSNLNVPGGKTLSLENGMSAVVEQGSTLSIDGTMNVSGSMTNNGTITNTSANSLHVGGTLVNNGTIDNSGLIGGMGSAGLSSMENGTNATISNTGTIKIADDGQLSNGGTLSNQGTIEGKVTETGNNSNTGGNMMGNLEISSGTYTINGGVYNNITVSGGTLEIAGGVINGEIKMTSGTFSMMGGSTKNEITVAGGTAYILGGNASAVSLTSGFLIFDSRSTDTIRVSGGEANIRGGAVSLIDVTGGSVIVDQGTVNELQASKGKVYAQGGNVEKLSMTGGILELNGGIAGSSGQINITNSAVRVSGGAVIKNGLTILGDSALLMEGGIIYAGSSTEALRVATNTTYNNSEVSEPNKDNTEVILTGGEINGNSDASVGLMIEKGTVWLNGVSIKANKAMNTVKAVSGDFYVWQSCAGRIYEHEYVCISSNNTLPDEMVPVCKKNDQYQMTFLAPNLEMAFSWVQAGERIVLDGDVKEWMLYGAILYGGTEANPVILDLDESKLKLQGSVAIEGQEEENGYLKIVGKSPEKAVIVHSDRPLEDQMFYVKENAALELENITVNSEVQSTVNLNGKLVLSGAAILKSGSSQGTVVACIDTSSFEIRGRENEITNYADSGNPAIVLFGSNPENYDKYAERLAAVVMNSSVRGLGKNVLVYETNDGYVTSEVYKAKQIWPNTNKYYYLTIDTPTALFDPLLPVVTATPSNADESPVQETRLATASNWKASSKATPSDATPSDAEADMLSLDTWQNRAAVADDDEDDDEPFDDEIFLIDDRKTTYWKDDEEEQEKTKTQILTGSSWWESIKARYKKEEES